MSNLEKALANTLFEHEPKLLACDLDATKKAAAEVANLLGWLMATIRTKDPDNFTDAMRLVFSNVFNAAERTAASRTPLGNMPKP